MTWISVLFDKLRELWPLVIVRTPERGVRFTLGDANPEPLLPGVYFRLWFFQSIEVEPVAEQTINLPTQSVTTRDDVAASVSGNISYVVFNIVKQYNRVHSFDSSLKNVAMTHIARRIRHWSWTELLEHQDDLELEILDALNRRIKKWGVRVVEVGITDLVRARQFRLFGDPPQE